MSSIRVAERYAKSLLDLAQEGKQVEEVKADIVALSQNLAASSDLRNLIKSPIIHGAVKRQIFEKLFEKKFQPLTMKFLSVVTRKGRENILGQIAQSFLEQYNAVKGITHVTVTSAVELSKDVLQTLQSKLENSSTTRSKVAIDTKIDPAIIGGYILEYDNKQYDASVRGKFLRLRKELTQ